jgi:hypothetical protein
MLFASLYSSREYTFIVDQPNTVPSKLHWYPPGGILGVLVAQEVGNHDLPTLLPLGIRRLLTGVSKIG